MAEVVMKKHYKNNEKGRYKKHANPVDPSIKRCVIQELLANSLSTV